MGNGCKEVKILNIENGGGPFSVAYNNDGTITVTDSGSSEDFILNICDAVNSCPPNAPITFNDSVTLDDSHHDKIIEIDSVGGVIATIDEDVSPGWYTVIVQKNSGKITIAAGGAGSVSNVDSHTRTRGEDSCIFVHVSSNPGSAPEVIFAGATE